MFKKSLTHARNDTRDRVTVGSVPPFVEFDRELIASLRTRVPMRYDRPSQSRKGSQRLGHWIATVGTRLANGRTELPTGAPRARVTIRPAETTDERDIARLSDLDERRVPTGYVLVAELDESIIAAMPLDGGHTVADPRRLTVDVIELLEVRSRQLREGSELAGAA